MVFDCVVVFGGFLDCFLVLFLRVCSRVKLDVMSYLLLIEDQVRKKTEVYSIILRM